MGTFVVTLICLSGIVGFAIALIATGGIPQCWLHM